MNLAVISDTRRPTGPDGHHGLGRSLYDIAAGLVQRGHAVTLYAGNGSTFEPGELRIYEGEGAPTFGEQYDAYLDGTHVHALSQEHPDWPVVNRIGDLECQYMPPNVVVAVSSMKRRYPTGRVIATGINVDCIPFYSTPKEYTIFLGEQIPRKGWPWVLDIAKLTDRPLAVGQNLTGIEKWNALGNASVLLHPSIEDAAPRLPLEAAACGVPTLCLSVSGTRDHVAEGITGFVCESFEEMADKVPAAAALDRTTIRKWVVACHGAHQMAEAYDDALTSVAMGKRWQ